MTRVRWDLTDRLSALHAAHCWAAGCSGIDAQLTSKIATPLADVSARLVAADIDLALFWRQLVADAAGGADDEQACSSALASAGLGVLAIDSTAAAIASGLAETRLAYQERFPKAAGQLELRARPIREQWDAYGPGLLRRIGKQTHESYVPKSVTGVMLSPYRGGDGDCRPAADTLWLEAVLTNPVPSVPEVLRVAWLVTRIGIGQQGLADAADTGPHTSTGERSSDRASLIVALAALPVTLDAAAYLEIGSAGEVDGRWIQAALSAWFPAGWGLAIGGTDQEVVETLANWWRQHSELQPPFPVTLKALDRMLPATAASQRGAL